MNRVLMTLLVCIAMVSCVQTTEEKTFLNLGNPLVRDNYTADPAPMVASDGRLYVFCGHDECFEDRPGYEGKYGFNITEWLCYSTEDMQVWTDHGVVMKPTDFSWAVGEAWASQVIEAPDGKYYFYVSTQSGDPDCKAIGVAVADSPTGPYVDAIGKALILDEMTPNGPRGWWNDFDPTVMIDDDGTPWLCWGNGTCFLARLKKNMTELDGDIMILPMENYVEGPWIYKRDGHYYNVYASMGEGRETVSYAMAPSIEGPWTFMGELTGMGDDSFTIHPGVIDYKGHSYLFYHNSSLSLDGYGPATGRRSICVDEMFYNPDGTIRPVSQTESGVSGVSAQSYSEKFADVDYVGDGQVYHKLDIYLPEVEKESYPVVIHVYGSAWFSNDSKGTADLGTIVSALLDAGYAVVTPNHRSSMDAKFPAQIHDIKAVVRYVRANADKYRFDTDFIATSGFSSGAHLASLAATSCGVAELEGSLGEYTDYSSLVDAACCWSGPIDLHRMSCGSEVDTWNHAPEEALMGFAFKGNEDAFKALNATTYIDPSDPPVVVFHGTADNVVPFCQGEYFYELLCKAGVTSEFHPVEGGGHGIGMYAPETLEAMVSFLEKTRAARKVKEDFVPSVSNQPGMMYPMVNSERVVRARLHAPDAARTEGFKDAYGLVFISYGSHELKDPRWGHDQEAITKGLKASGMNAHFYVSPDTAHEWQTWRRSFHRFAQLLFK